MGILRENFVWWIGKVTCSRSKDHRSLVSIGTPLGKTSSTKLNGSPSMICTNNNLYTWRTNAIMNYLLQLCSQSFRNMFTATNLEIKWLINFLSRTRTLKKSISFQAVSLWNGLSLELKISRMFKEFKKSVKALKL
jgi:hypothetical protein